jgi:GT2 family glycosyltransferase
MAVSGKTIERVGLLNEKYFLYYEDTDWSVRMKKRGLKVLYEPKARLWHINAGSTEGSGSAMHQYYQTRNKILFASKFAPIRIKVAVWREGLRLWTDKYPAVRAGAKDGLFGVGGRRHDL